MRISYKNLKRYKEIAHVLIKYGFSVIVEKLNIEEVAYKIPITNPSEEIKNMSTATKIRCVIEELGPTYIKFGQLLSTRKDLFDQDIIDELSKLRDSVEPFDTDIAKAIFKNETGLDIDDIFKEFNDIPIGSASIGQVYEGKLKNNEDVIVKIQRPNIEETIKSDIEILRSIALALKDLYKDIDIDLKQVIEEFNTQLMRELDYNFEAMNAIKFKKMFEDSKEVYIPSIYSEYSTEKVLIMEKIIGNEQEIKELLSKESVDDLYEFFLRKDSTLTMEEFDDEVYDILENYSKNSNEEIDQNTLEQISGGQGSFLKKTLAVS